MAYRSDEFVYGIFAPEPSATDEYINELLAEKVELEGQIFRLNERLRDIGEELAELEVGA